MSDSTTTTTTTTTTSTEVTELPKLEGQALKDALVKQLEYYFSKENLMTDRFLLSQMNSEMFVPIKVIANFKMIKSLTPDLDLIVSTLKEIKNVVLDETNTLVRPNLKPQKNVIILREIPSTTPAEEIKAIFNNEHCGKVTDIRSDINDFWYVTFEDDDHALKSLEYIREQKLNGQPIKARIKIENTFRSLFASALASASDQSVAPEAYNTQTRYPQGQNWVEVPTAYTYEGYAQQYESDPNYAKGGYDNKRGGYRKQGNRNYNRGGAKGSYKGKSDKENTNTRKRRESGGSAHVLQFNSQQFPPLPSQEKKKAGYETEFLKYSKQDIVDIISKIQITSKPNASETSSKALAAEPNLTLEVTKPWPNKKHDEEPSHSTKTETPHEEPKKATENTK